MKLMICSDLHGSAEYAQKIKEIFLNEKADKLILLGDIYNHGPRNSLPQGYSPAKTAEILNSLADKLIVIKGNCDSEVDTMISDFDFVSEFIFSDKNKYFFCSHGHVYNETTPPKGRYDAIIYGHFHKAFLKKTAGMLVMNPGSISLPKDGLRAYITYSDGIFTLKQTDGKVISEICID